MWSGSPDLADVYGLQAAGKPESEIDVGPVVLAGNGPRADNSRGDDPIIRPCKGDEAFAEIVPLPRAEHKAIVFAATSHRVTFRAARSWWSCGGVRLSVAGESVGLGVCGGVRFVGGDA